LLAYWLARAPAVSPDAQISENFIYPSPNVAQIKWDAGTNTITPDNTLPPWVFTSKLVAKPDQLIKRRGKSGLLLLNKEWPEAKEWITARAGKPTKVRTRRSSSSSSNCLFSSDFLITSVCTRIIQKIVLLPRSSCYLGRISHGYSQHIHR